MDSNFCLENFPGRDFRSDIATLTEPIMRTPTMEGTVMNLSESVILPREDFIELQTAAWDQTPPSLSTRAAQSAQTTYVCVMLATVVVGATWGCTKAVDWLENRRLARQRAANDPTCPEC